MPLAPHEIEALRRLDELAVEVGATPFHLYEESFLLQDARLEAEKSQEKWDRDFLALARWWAERKSKDPSTKTGACITRGRDLISLGYNGFAPGVEDRPERYADRDTKLELVVHCEVAAIIRAARPLHGCTLYTWPFMSCARCAALVISSGITRCVAPVLDPTRTERWGSSCDLARQQFKEAGVELVLLEGCQ